MMADNPSDDSQTVRASQQDQGEPARSKLVVTFFANIKRSLLSSENSDGHDDKLSSTCEPSFTNILLTLLSPAPVTLDAVESLSPRVSQSTYLVPSNINPQALRHKPPVARLEETNSVEIVLDLLPNPSTSSHRPIGLAVFDMDSTLIEEEVIDELARSVGVTAAVSTITAQAMNGEIDFEQSLRARLALLEGVNTHVWGELQKSITIAAGARELCRELRRRGVIMAVASGGFAPMVEWLKDQLGLDYAFANHVRFLVPIRPLFLDPLLFVPFPPVHLTPPAPHLPTHPLLPARPSHRPALPRPPRRHSNLQTRHSDRPRPCPFHPTVPNPRRRRRLQRSADAGRGRLGRRMARQAESAAGGPPEIERAQSDRSTVPARTRGRPLKGVIFFLFVIQTVQPCFLDIFCWNGSLLAEICWHPFIAIRFSLLRATASLFLLITSDEILRAFASQSGERERQRWGTVLFSTSGGGVSLFFVNRNRSFRFFTLAQLSSLHFFSFFPFWAFLSVLKNYKRGRKKPLLFKQKGRKGENNQK